MAQLFGGLKRQLHLAVFVDDLVQDRLADECRETAVPLCEELLETAHRLFGDGTAGQKAAVENMPVVAQRKPTVFSQRELIGVEGEEHVLFKTKDAVL